MTEKQENRTIVAINTSYWKYLKKWQLNTKLLLACSIRDANATEKAIKYGANVNCRRTDSMAPLHIAAEHDDVEIMRLLCKSVNINPEVKTMHVEIRTKSLNHSSKQGLTAMHTAALVGHMRVMKELINFGARTSCKDNLQRCPIHYAALHSNVDCARYLIKSGSPVHVYDVFQETPLHISVLKTKNLPMIKLLLVYRSRRSPFTPRDAQRILLEAILSARNRYDIDIIGMILHYGGDVINLSDLIGGRTPLHIVAMTGYYELAEYLIDRGADLKVKNRAKETPMQVAMNCKNLSIARLIQDELRRIDTGKFMRRIIIDLAQHVVKLKIKVEK